MNTNPEEILSCPHCTKLWEKLETLESEKAKVENAKSKIEKQMAFLLPLLIVQLVLSSIGLLLKFAM